MKSHKTWAAAGMALSIVGFLAGCSTGDGGGGPQMNTTSMANATGTTSATNATTSSNETTAFVNSPAKPTTPNTSDPLTVNATSANPVSRNATSEAPSGLPDSFQTYQDVWNSMGPYLAHHTSAQVWMPTLKGLPHFALKPWMNVQYRITQTGYTLSVFVGPKLPPNSSKIIAGNAEMIYSITALNKGKPVPQSVNWDNTSAVIPNAKTQTIRLGHGVTGIMYTGKLDGLDRRDIVWKQGGWTFGWESQADESVKTTVGYAQAMMVDDTLMKSLPIKSGYFLSGEGSGGPSQVEFVAGNTRYIMYAPGGRALQIMDTMVRV